MLNETFSTMVNAMMPRKMWTSFIAAVQCLVFLQCIPSSESDFRMTCYYDSSAYYRSSPMHFWVEDVPVDLCETLVYGFIGLNDTTWEIEILQPYVDIQLGGFEKAIDLKRRPTSRLNSVLIGLSENREGMEKYLQMASDPVKRQICVDSVVHFIRSYGFDGLAINWNHIPGNADGSDDTKRDFVLLVKALKDAFNPNGWKLTAAVSAKSDTILSSYDVPSLGWLLDEIHVTTFDMRDVWTGKADCHSPLYSKESDPPDLAKMNVNHSIQTWHSLGAPMDKIFLGIPCYGRSFTLRDPQDHWPLAESVGPGKQGEYTNEPGLLAYYEICTKVQSDSWNRGFDTETKVPFIFKGDQWIGFDDSQSIANKVNYVKKTGLGGVALWTIDMDDFRGICGMDFPLLRIFRLRLKSLGNPWLRNWNSFKLFV